MIEYGLNNHAYLFELTFLTLRLATITILLSAFVSIIFITLSVYSGKMERLIHTLLSMAYCIPSLALLALLVPLTGLSEMTAVIALTFYNQYIIVKNVMAGFYAVDPAVVESAKGLGMSPIHIIMAVLLPLSKPSLIAALRLTFITTISISTIAACINVKDLGVLFFDGLRTLNTYKIVWGCILTAGTAIIVDYLLIILERKASIKMKEK